MKNIVLFTVLLLSLNTHAGSHNGSHEEKHEDSHEKAPASKNDFIVSQPADCLSKQTLPCTFKSIARHSSAIGNTQFVFLKNTVVKVLDFASLNLEPVVGGFVITASKSSVSVKGVSLAKFPSYADTTKGQVEVIDGKDFYVYKFSEGEPERYLLDREPFIKKLAGFYNNIESLKAEYKNISPIYNKSFKQDVVLHKKVLTRRIASVEEEKKQEAERLKRLREEQRKNKEIFFKRTFVQ